MGLSTLVWADHFSEVTGIDPMPDAAKEKLHQEKRGSVDYMHAGEELSFFSDNPVAMAAAGGYHIVSSTKHL